MTAVPEKRIQLSRLFAHPNNSQAVLKQVDSPGFGCSVFVPNEELS